MSLWDSAPWSKITAISFASLGYLSLVRFLRWRRYVKVHKKYAGRIDSLTPQDAQNIMLTAYLYDMPGLLDYATSFALFKTFSIPSISGLLLKTKEISSADNISRRYADTELLISTWLVCPITGRYEIDKKSDDGGLDPRAAISIARTNWLHSKYKISNEAYLYTLSLFVLEPIRWCERSGWRPLSPLECQAHYVFWVEVGRHMKINDIPESLEDLETWSKVYEEAYMVPATSNRDVARFTMDEMLHVVPKIFGIKEFLRKLVICLLEERVRKGMMQPEQPWYLHALVDGIMRSVAFAHRHTSLPRLSEQSVLNRSMPKTWEGPLLRMYPTKWRAKPWYKPKSKTVIGRVLDRIWVAFGFHDAMPGPELNCDGYRLEEVGPVHMQNFGHEEVMRMAAEIQGCPITGPLSLNGGRR